MDFCSVFLRIVICLVLPGVFACATSTDQMEADDEFETPAATTKNKASEKSQREVQEIVLQQGDPIRARRPASAGANPSAGPGGLDYTSAVLPDQNYDCRKMETLFDTKQFPAVLDCFKSIQSGTEVKYKLIRNDQPELRLLQEESTPACLKTLLPAIPIPREIFFVSREHFRPTEDWEAEDADPRCYSSRIALDADRVMGVRVAKAQYVLKLFFPLDPKPQSPADLLRWFGGVALTPFFWAQERGQARAVVVPESICGQCFGDPDVLRKREHVPSQVWP